MLLRALAWMTLIMAIALSAGCGGGEGPHEAKDTLGLDVPEDAARVQDMAAVDVIPDGEPGDLEPDLGWVEPPELIVVEGEGGGTLEITTDPLGMVLKDGDGALLWDAGEQPLLFGLVEEKNEAMRYDCSMVPAAVSWVAPGPVEEMKELRGGVALRLPLGEGDTATRIELVVTPGGVGTLTVEATPEDTDHVVLTRLGYTPLDDQENFYGLGENYDHPARRGTMREMHFTPFLPSEGGYNEAHVPIPLLISTAGSGVFVEDRHPGTWDVALADPDRVTATWTVPALRFHLLWAEHPMDVLPRYYEITGYPALPPVWAFGILQWQDEVDGQAEVMDDAWSMRELDLPCSAIWVDRPYAVPHTFFEFNQEWYPDSVQMVKDLNDLGFRVAIWSAPYLSEDLVDEYAYAEEHGFFVTGDIQFAKFGSLMDFTNPDAVAYWQDLVHLATDIGIEGFKLDYGEDIQAGFGPIKINMDFHSGETAQVMHKKYAMYYHQAYEDTVPGGSFQINRAGTYGDQTITDVIWPGDLDADFRFHMEEDFYVGGLPAAIAAGLSLSTSGYPFFGSDTGGYRNNRPTEEVLLRWVSQTANSTTLQFGGAGANCNPWDFNEYLEDVDWQDEPIVSKYDEDTVETWRRFAKLHIRLFPYTYTQAVAAVSGGRPVLRPYGFALPESGLHPDFIYFHGDNLLVAPVYRSEMDPEVPLPSGSRWVHWWTGEVYEGGTTETFPQPPLSQSVLLAREGSVIPMLRPTVDTLAPATDPEVDSYGNDPGRLWLTVFPAAEGGPVATVFDGSTAVVQAPAPHWTLDLVQGDTFDGWVAEIRLHAQGGADAVDVVTVTDGASLDEAVTAGETATCDGCWFMDEDAQTLWIGLGPGDQSVSFGPAL